MLCLFAYNSKAQSADSLTSVKDIPAKYYSQVDKKVTGVSNNLTKKSLKYLAKFQRQEQKLQERLSRLNPDNSAILLSSANNKYKELSQGIKSKTGLAGTLMSGAYNPNLDSLGTSLSFLKQFNSITDKVKDPLKNFDDLQGRLQQAGNIQEFIAERKNQIKELLSKYTTLPAGLKNEYTRLNKTAYYYSAQVQEYKAMLKDPDKMERKAMSILRQMPAFQKFWQKNSEIAQLFPMPSGYGTVQALAGLQTNAQVQQIAFQHMGTSSSNSANFTQYIQQQMNTAQSALNQLKDKVAQLGGTTGSGSVDLPDFKPDGQKTKSLWNRLEYGINIQNMPKTSFIPAISDIGVSLGYKFSDKINAGVGSSYKLGLGNGIQHLHLTSEGASLRSYLDVKAKGNFWMSGGWEYNYYQSFSKLTDLKNIDAWQKSALIGIKKKYKVGKKDGSIQLLYDLLANTETPRSNGLKFRIGYNL